MTEIAQIVVRLATEDDKAFVLNSWLKSQYYSSDYFGAMTNIGYYFFMTPLILNKLKEGLLNVAVLSDAPETIIGFACSDGNTLHYVYVKRDYRGHKIASLLLSGLDVKVYTASTKAGSAIARKRGWEFNPFL